MLSLLDFLAGHEEPTATDVVGALVVVVGRGVVVVVVVVVVVGAGVVGSGVVGAGVATWQAVPVYPAAQVHVKLSPFGRQVPPFRQGSTSHTWSFRASTVSQLSPENLGAHAQEGLPRMTTQTPPF